MWKLEKEFRFEAAHQLPNHLGKCRRLHGHSWVARIVVEADELRAGGSSAGMVMDFATIKDAMEPILEEKLDHHFLNETLPMPNPTSEEIARWLFERLEHVLPGLAAVIIEETCTCRCEYRPNI